MHYDDVPGLLAEFRSQELQMPFPLGHDQRRPSVAEGDADVLEDHLIPKHVVGNGGIDRLNRLFVRSDGKAERSLPGDNDVPELGGALLLPQLAG